MFKFLFKIIYRKYFNDKLKERLDYQKKERIIKEYDILEELGIYDLKILESRKKEINNFYNKIYKKLKK